MTKSRDAVDAAAAGSGLIAGAAPLFVLGPPRSGTTLLARILNAHPRVLVTNETAVFMQIGESVEKSQRGLAAGVHYGKHYNELWADHLLSASRQVVESYYEKIAEIEGKQELAYWGEKHPHLAFYLDYLDQAYPEARYVYSVRDPRDVACSIAEMNEIGISKAIETWAIFAPRLEAFIAKLAPERVAHVRYEEMIHDYEGGAREVLAKLDLDYCTPVADFVEEARARDAHVYESATSDRFDFVKKSFERWRREMSSEDLDYSAYRQGPVLKRYHYAPAESVDPAGVGRDEVVFFECNICGCRMERPRREIRRDEPSCDGCESTLQLRSLVHLLSMEIYGEGRLLTDFGVKLGVAGIDMEGCDGSVGEYCRIHETLEKKLNCVKTYAAMEPMVEITRAAESDFSDLDFVIASGIFEHVPPPVSRAFEGARNLLAPGGLLLLTAPYRSDVDVDEEYYPELYDYEVVENGDEWLLQNTRRDGSQETFREPKFHGEVGEALEMRMFSKRGLQAALENAGFFDVQFHDESVPRFGIFWDADYWLPVTARRKS